MNKIYYSQADSRWANHPYPCASYPNATIKSGGCGATSGAMVVSMLRQIVYPNQIGDEFIKTGYRVNGGTSGKGFLYLAEKYNLECNVNVKLDDAVACLKRGGLVIMNVKAGSVFSTGGHYIVLVSYDNDTFTVFDPYMYTNKFNTASRRDKVRVDGNTCYINYANMKEYGNYSYLYCFEPTESQTEISKYKAGQSIIIKTDIAYTGTSQGDLLLVENKNMDIDDRKQFWIHKSVLENNNSVLHALGIICYVEGKRYLVQVFTEQFWVMEDSLIESEPVATIKVKNTTGQTKKLNTTTTIYSNSNLTGNKYTYKANTSIIVIENVSSEVDKVKVVQTGRIGYIKNNQYK